MARQQGVSYRTALNWFHAGVLPVPARQLPTGTVLVEPPAAPSGRAVAYCRASPADQREDLERQARAGRAGVRPARDLAYRDGHRGWVRRERQPAETGPAPAHPAVTTIVVEHRDRLAAYLSDPAVTVIVVEHRDRLARFGLEQLAAALSACGRGIVVLDEAEMVEVLARVCARWYGRRWARKRADAAVRAARAAP